MAGKTDAAKGKGKGVAFGITTGRVAVVTSK